MSWKMSQDSTLEFCIDKIFQKFSEFYQLKYLFVHCIFHTENFSLIWRRRHYRWRGAKFDLYLALTAIGQLWIFNMPHLLWHENHLEGHIPFTPDAERLEEELSLPVLTTQVCRDRNSNNFPHARRTPNLLRHRRSAPCINDTTYMYMWIHLLRK